MTRLPLEDNFTDVIGKAQRGLELTNSALAAISGISLEAIRRLKQGEVDAMALEEIAPHLNLDAKALVAMARKKWYPEIPVFPNGFEMFTTVYGDMTVNSYLVWDPESNAAAAFDTGASCEGMLGSIQRRELEVQMIFLTHSHDDHIEDLPALRGMTRASVWLSDRGSMPEVFTFPEGREFKLGSLRISTLHTYGHADDGATFLVNGLAHPLAIVGDSLFASSMGGGLSSYDDAYRNNVDKILPLPDETVIASGHGPLTTLGQEKLHNPFFAKTKPKFPAR